MSIQEVGSTIILVGRQPGPPGVWVEEHAFPFLVFCMLSTRSRKKNTLSVPVYSLK
jgi:hypothetical protein